MRRVIETAAISLLLSLLASPSAALTINLGNNPLGLDYGPAPSPEDGPPLSAGALRNPAYLPAEIGGIIGAYFFIVTVVGIALLFIGRRLRIETQRSKDALQVEMLQPTNIYPSPISPRSGLSKQNFSWPSPEKTDRNPYVFPSTSSTKSPIDPAVDSRVIQADQENLHNGLVDIYAHVMAHEEAKAVSRMNSSTSLPQSHLSPPTVLPQPIPAAAPQRPVKEKAKPMNMSIDVAQSKPAKGQSRASSIISSLKSPRKKGLRNIQISSPIPTPLSQSFPRDYASDEEPLSPVHYSPPPPPPVPKDQVPYTHSRNNSAHTTGTDPSPISPARSIAEQLATSQPIRHYHNPSQTSIKSTASRPTLPSNPAPKKAPPQLAITTPAPSNPPSKNNSTRTLPFRAYDPPAGLSSPSFSYSTKTTVLERTTPAMMSPGLRTPWTAGAVPYSPYQPQTPLTPYTPRLVTREERKMKKKLEGRGPVLEMIKGEDELWDSGY